MDCFPLCRRQTSPVGLYCAHPSIRPSVVEQDHTPSRTTSCCCFVCYVYVDDDDSCQLVLVPPACECERERESRRITAQLPRLRLRAGRRRLGETTLRAGKVRSTSRRPCEFRAAPRPLVFQARHGVHTTEPFRTNETPPPPVLNKCASSLSFLVLPEPSPRGPRGSGTPAGNAKQSTPPPFPPLLAPRPGPAGDGDRNRRLGYRERIGGSIRIPLCPAACVRVWGESLALAAGLGSASRPRNSARERGGSGGVAVGAHCAL